MNTKPLYLILFFTASVFYFPHLCAASKTVEQDGFNTGEIPPDWKEIAPDPLTSLQKLAVAQPTAAQLKNTQKLFEELSKKNPSQWCRIRIETTKTELALNEVTGQLFCLATGNCLLSEEELAHRGFNRLEAPRIVGRLLEQNSHFSPVILNVSTAEFKEVILFPNYPAKGSLSILLKPKEIPS